MTQKENKDLTSLINRVRAGETAAIEVLVLNYSDELKAAIRSVLNVGNRLRRTIDSNDILQSIVLRLLDQSENLTPVGDGAAYLGTMAKNRVLAHGRKLATQKRDANRVSYGEEALGLVADGTPSPSAILIQKELFERVWKALSDSEKVVVEDRMANKTWEEIAAKNGVKADAIRMRFRRKLQMLEQSTFTG